MFSVTEMQANGLWKAAIGNPAKDLNYIVGYGPTLETAKSNAKRAYIEADKQSLAIGAFTLAIAQWEGKPIFTIEHESGESAELDMADFESVLSDYFYSNF